MCVVKLILTKVGILTGHDKINLKQTIFLIAGLLVIWWTLMSESGVGDIHDMIQFIFSNKS